MHIPSGEGPAVLRHPASPRSRSRWFQRSHAASLPGSPPQGALSSLATFLEDAVAPSLAPPPEPVRAAARSHLLRGCQPVTLPLLRPVLGVLAAGRGGPPPVRLQAGTLHRAAVPLRTFRLCCPVPSSPDVPSRSPRLASPGSRPAGLTWLPALSSLPLQLFFQRTRPTPSSLTF